MGCPHMGCSHASTPLTPDSFDGSVYVNPANWFPSTRERDSELPYRWLLAPPPLRAACAWWMCPELVAGLCTGMVVNCGSKLLVS